MSLYLMNSRQLVYLLTSLLVNLIYIPFIDKEMRLRFLSISITFTLTC